MLLPCFAIRHLSLNLAYRLIGAGYVRYCWKTNQNCATSVVVSRDHSQNSIININKIRSSRKNLKHVSIELWHFFLNTLSKVKQKLIRLRAYCKLGLLGLQAKPWCCGLCRGWKEDWNSSNYRVKPIFSYKIRLTPKKILARLFFNGNFSCVNTCVQCVLFIYLCSTERVVSD